MPRDIRSYFTPVASQKKNSDPENVIKKRRIISSDEDEEIPKTPTKRSKIARKTKKTSVLLDSEDEEVVVEYDKKNSKQSKASKKNENEKSRIAISPGDLFKKKPITRIEESKKTLQQIESEFHDDSDFDAVLKQLDTSPAKMTYNDSKKKKDNNTENKNVPKNLNLSIETEGCKNEKQNDDELKTSHNANKTTKTKQTKKSVGKTSNAKDIESSPKKRKLQSEKKNSSSPNKDFDTCNHKLKKSKLNISTSDSATDDKEAKKTSGKNATVDLIEEKIKKKKNHSLMYEKYLQRGGARNPGSKQIPTGAKNCLAGVSFVITGVLDSLERTDAEDLIRQYGGRTVNCVSKKINFIIVGDEPGPAKLEKADNLGIKRISEDDLIEMIRTRPEGKTEDIKPTATRAKPKSKNLSKESEIMISPTKTITEDVKMLSPKQIALDTSTKSTHTLHSSFESQPLVEKYRPKTMKQIVGQQGDRSCAHNLYVWLRDWHKNRQDPKIKDAKQTNGQIYKAALLSGAPGIGKTTTAQVVCKELGYDLVEFNASDTRNKNLLKAEVSGLLSNTTMKDFVTGTTQKITKKHVLLMDEVDGMAGNEDRGGLQELVNLIKHTDVPIICICNDRFNTKMKTIVNYCYDLKFPKLRVEQIRSSMKSLCYKEKIEISTQDLDHLIESTNHDIRQVINHLEFLSSQTSNTETINKPSKKDFKLGPFDVVKMAFNAEEQKKLDLNNKISLYFHDYNIAPLFIEENYLSVRIPQTSPLQKLEKISKAADSISHGDLVEKVMRSNMMWSLLPMHACFSFVIPGNELAGSLDAMVRFPSWFGRNSKTMRFNRLLQELTTHTRLTTGASKDALNMDYLTHIRNAIVKPLIDKGTDGIENAIDIMKNYHLTREDLDSIIEISLWPGVSDPTSNLESKVKAAFTRAYQKSMPMLPYAINSNVTAKKRSTPEDDEAMEEEDNEEENDDINSDRMIKAKKINTAASTSKASSKRNGEPTKKRGRGRAKEK
ncbi:replication factor C subunit 1 isoform X2 [Pseudomyrmex gracilis]|uniref:replication factor C subunit 1 isoform X2 n=1 Tax=Pseudomyrmex gracilis TaxID=219809 RepID=UPI0009957299|nr:replication factor C subunit 1 isoform X2 [Pseudomyrmex gracilis]